VIGVTGPRRFGESLRFFRNAGPGLPTGRKTKLGQALITTISLIAFLIPLQIALR